jgi:hypothetical protein
VAPVAAAHHALVLAGKRVLGRLPAPCLERACFRCARQGFRWLMMDLRPGDSLVFHYSGAEAGAGP